MTERAKKCKELWAKFDALSAEYRRKGSELISKHGIKPDVDPLHLYADYFAEREIIEKDWKHICNTLLQDCYSAEIPSEEEEQAFLKDYNELVERHGLAFEFEDYGPRVRVPRG